MKASGILTGTDYLIVSQGSSQASLSPLPLIHSANHSTGLNLGSCCQLAGLSWLGSFHSFVQQLLQHAGSLPAKLLPCPAFLPDTQDYTGLESPPSETH